MKRPSKIDGRLYVLLLIVVDVITHWRWLFDFSIFTSGDWAYISLPQYVDFRHFSPIWVTSGLGSTSAVPPFYFVRFLEGLTTYVGGSFIINEKLFFFVPIVLGSTFGAYFFLRQYLASFYAFLGALLFAFNTAMLFNYAGALTIATAYALTPIALYLFRKLLYDPKNRSVLIGSALVFAILAAYEQRIVLLVWAMAIGLLVFKTGFAESRPAYFRSRAAATAKLLGLFVALHAFWLIPYVVNAKAGVTFSDLLSRQLFDSFSSIQNSLTLYHPFWTGARPATFVIQSIPVFAWLLPFLAFGGFLWMRVWRRRKVNDEVFYWAFIALIGMFLVKQSNGPFVQAYPWLYAHVPGAAAFREASKFYLLIALGYAVLIPNTLSLLRHVDVRNKHIKPETLRASFYVLVSSLLLLIAWNVKPLVTNGLRTLYTPHKMPSDYTILDNYINKQHDYFRTLWAPAISRWGVQGNGHPALAASQMTQGAWFLQLGASQDDPFATLRDKTTGLFSQETSATALDRATVKYVIVPLRDTASDDDFFHNYGDNRQYYIDQLDTDPYLKKINIGTSQVVVYQNMNYTSYVAATASLQTLNLENNTPIDNFYQIATQKLGDDFNFLLSSAKNSQDVPATSIIDPFASIRVADIANGQLAKQVHVPQGASLYIDTDNQHVRYAIEDGAITFYGSLGDALKINGQPIDSTTQEKTLATANLQRDHRYYLEINGKPVEISSKDGQRDLGNVTGPLQLYEADSNVLANPSFEKGLWQQNVQDCNHYDNKADIGMSLDKTNAEQGKASLEFYARNHTACTTSAAIPVHAGNYLLSFAYLISGGQTVGYNVIFDDPKHTVISNNIDSQHSYWETYRQVIAVPEGATSFTIQLLGYPDYLMQGTAVTNYDNLNLEPLTMLAALPAPTADYNALPLPAGNTTLSYPVQNVSTDNLVPNGSFDKSLWHPKVGDCDAYDINPIISEKLIGRAGNGQALELDAKRHAACTSQNVPVEESQDYLFSFDYQSPNAKEAYYRLEFNDQDATIIQATVPVTSQKWSTFSRQIQVPLGATNMKVTLFSYEGSEKIATVIDRYDNVSLRSIAPVAGRYYMVTPPPARAANVTPQVSYTNTAATKKNIQVSNTKTPFYLSLAESYNPLWRLELAPSKSTGASLLAMLPWSYGSTVPATQHIKLNDFENGWYVDPAALCKTDAWNCHRNADGSYNLVLVAEFSAQRWFYVGSFVSLVTFLSCVSYMAYWCFGRRGLARKTVIIKAQISKRAKSTAFRRR